MADPTTTNKFLAQPTRGSDVGVWDTPVNANMGIIDNSLGGTATIALTNSPVTLSSAQYQCAFLKFTGAISANIAITLPSVGSFYTVINQTTNSSAFFLTLTTTAAGGQAAGIPPGECTEFLTDGSNVKFKNLPHIGSYWDYAGSSVPAWVSACTVPPWLNCDGTSFSSATYPQLTAVLGSTTLPDARGRARFALDQGTGRTTSSAVTGFTGNIFLAGGGADTNTLGSSQMPSHTHTVIDPGHHHTYNSANIGVGGAPGNTVNAPGAGNTSSDVTNISLANTGGGAAHNNMPPALAHGLTLIRAG